MIDPDSVREIVRTYEKHGWLPRRFLFSPELAAKVRSSQPPTDSVPIHASDIDAAWFSRPPKRGGVAWELRYLGEPAFALLENIDEAEDHFEDSLRAVETRLKDAIAGKKAGLTSE
jgi:hypothetical protein